MESKTINMEHKSVSNISDVDTASRRVKVVISAMGNLDQDGDVIHEKAYDKTIAERGPKGKNMIYFLRDHNASIGGGLIGKFSELYTEGKQLIGVAVLPETAIGRDMMEHYQSGNINMHSVGFTTLEAENVKGASPYRLIKSAKMWEGSAVLFGSNEMTPTLSVGKNFKSFEARVNYAESIFAEHTEVLEELKSGKHVGDNYELLVIRFENINNLIKEMVLSTGTDEKSSLPAKPVEIIKGLAALNGLISAKNTHAANEAREIKRAAEAHAGRLSGMLRAKQLQH